jgi:hypothetical protein
MTGFNLRRLSVSRNVRHCSTKQNALRSGCKIEHEANIKRSPNKDSIARFANAEGQIVDSGPHPIRKTYCALIDLLLWSEVDIYKICQCHFQRLGSCESVAVSQHPWSHLEVLVDVLRDFSMHELVLGHRQSHDPAWIIIRFILIGEGMKDKLHRLVWLEVISCPA